MEFMLGRHFRRSHASVSVPGVSVDPAKRRTSPDAGSQMVCDHLQGRTPMRMIAILIAALATIGTVVPASAQMSSATRAEMAKMRASNPASFATCHALAVQRGYNDVDHEQEGRALMNFISGCMHGRG